MSAGEGFGSYDVVIVGGGLIGSLSALALADAGRRVLVLEKAVPGAEASSAAAGILAGQSESKVDNALFALAIESRERYAALSASLRERTGLDVGYRRCGVLDVAESDEALAELERGFRFQHAHGQRYELVHGTALRELEPKLSRSFAGGVHFADDAQVDPPSLFVAVAQAAERAGVTFRSGTTVRSVRIERETAVGVDVEDGHISAGHVVVAAGAWSALVHGAQLAPGAVKPARGQIVELSLRSPPLDRVVFGRGGYVVPRGDGRVLCGSTLEFVGFQKDVTVGGVAKILAMATALVPSLESAKISRMWSNFRPYSPDGAALVGDAGVRGLTLATGHHRSGILFAPATAERVRQHVVEGRIDRAEPWAPSRLG